MTEEGRRRLTGGRLHALKVDPRSALSKFQGDIRRLLDDASGFELGGVSPKRMLEEVGRGLTSSRGC